MDPRITFWVALWSRVLAVDTPHLAYSFNFPELPRGWKRRLFSYAYDVHRETSPKAVGNFGLRGSVCAGGPADLR
jgi:hypothetical protein